MIDERRDQLPFGAPEVVFCGSAAHTHGLSDLGDTRIPREKLEALQRNLIRSHSAGAGRELTREEVRAMVLTRCNAFVKGYSGIRLLVGLLNERVHPVIPSRGSLGASGDLAPLAHLALVLIGEGEADVERDGTGETERLSGDEALSGTIERERE